MPTVSTLNSTALLILQPLAVLPVEKDQSALPGAGLLAAANGVVVPGVSDAQAQAKAKISESFFDNGVDLQELKFHLYRRLGEELGINMGDYENPKDYAAALKDAVGDIKANSEDGGLKFFAGLEKKLGLDKLGLSIDDLVNAIEDPDGKASKKLDEALRAKTGEDAKAAVLEITTDEDGRYSF